MKVLLLVFVFSFSVLAQEVLAQEESSFLWKQPKTISQTFAINTDKTFDPFIDYGEFEEDITEEESLAFFQYGRSLAISFKGGYEAVTFNLRQIYGDSGFVGMGISFFIDFHLAVQVSGVFAATHYNSLYNTGFPFAHFGLDMKYYWNRQYINEEKNRINPYLIFGPLWMHVKPDIQVPEPLATTIPLTNNQNNPNSNLISQLDRKAISSENYAGAKVGFGVEVSIIKQVYAGLEFTYIYSSLPFENEDLTKLSNLPPLDQKGSQSFIEFIQYPPRPELRGYRFYGDFANIALFIGMNF